MNYYIVDAFTSEKFKGNPAGVCILEKIICKYIKVSVSTSFGDIHRKEIAITGHIAENVEKDL